MKQLSIKHYELSIKQLLLPLVMAIVMMAMSPTMAWAISGSGTSSSPYQISSASDWSTFRNAVNSRSSADTKVYAKLTGSFTISSGDYTPVGTSSKPFYGEFNGQGYTITLSNAKGSSDDFGLFGYVSNATIQNLKVAGTLTVTGTKKHIGGIVAYLKGASTIKGCTFSGTLDAGSSYDSNGGIVGFAENGFSGSITNCFCNAIFKTTSSDSNPTFGGIVGYFNDESSKLPTISNNFSDSQFLKSGSSYTSSYTNGIIGRIRNKATNVTNNIYITSSSLSRACNNDGPTIDSSNKAITISVTAGSNGSVSKSYVYPTSTTATKLQVVASPSSHYVFDKWTSSSSSSTSLSTSTPYSVELTSSVSLHANFKLDSHAIKVTSANTTMGTVTGTANYTHGQSAKITATAQTGYSFDYWMNGSTKSTTNPISFTVESDQTYTAYFKVNQYKITATTNNEKYGTVTGGGTYDYNKSVTLTATPATGYHFVSWNDGNTKASRQITVTGAATYTATFEAHAFTSKEIAEAYLKSAATCTEAATYYYKCSRCSAKGTEYYTSTDDKDKALGHDFTSKTTTEAYLESAATCTEAATYYYKCSRCSEMGTEHYTSTEDKDKAKGHTAVTDRAVEATCTETGLTEGSHCSVCKAVIVAQESTQAKGHSTPVIDVAVEATCTRIGLTEGSHCSLCEEVIVAQETIPAKDHSADKVGAVAATCGDTGNTEHWKCVFCGMLFSDEACTTETTLEAVTIARAHNWSDDTHTYCTKCDHSWIYYTASKKITPSTPASLSGYYDANNTFDSTTKQGVIELPSKLTSIGKDAFDNCNFFSITIPSSVTSIGEDVFAYCDLQSITIPSSVTSIGDGAFFCCSGLGSVAFNSIPLVGNIILYNCDDLNTKTLTLTDDSYVAADKGNFPTLTKAPTFTREMTTEWETIVVPFAVTYKQSNADYKLYQLVGTSAAEISIIEYDDNTTIPAGTPMLIKAIGSQNASGKYEVTLTANGYDVSTTINNPAAISGLTLTGTYAKASVATGAGYVFDGTQFVKTTVSTDVAPFHAYLDGAIADVEAITLQDHVHSIAKVDAKAATCGDKGNIEHWKCNGCGKPFSDAEGKTETTLAAVTIARAHNWSDDSHTYCTKCDHSWIYYTAKNKVTPYTPASLSGYDDANNTYDSTTKQGVIELPSKLTSIGQNAFNCCTSLQSITIPSSVTSIGEKAFNYCTSLQSITILSSVTSIGKCAFYDCSSLQSITIPSSVTSIGEDAFYDCMELGSVAFNSIPKLLGDLFHNCFHLNTYTLALTDDSYVAADKGNFPTLTKAPTFTRTLTTEWETIVVPFAITYKQSNADYKLYQLVGTSAAEISIIEYDDNATIPAGTPMLIKAIGSKNAETGKYEVTLTANGYDVSTTINTPAAISGLTLTGTYAKASVAAGAGYVFNGTQFVKTTVSTDVAPFHAYLDGAIDGVDDITPKIHIHSIVKVDAKAATCGDTGNTEHWKCNGCGKLYSDAEGTNETTLATVTTNALGHQFDANNKCTVCQLVVDPAQAVRLSSTASSGTSGYSGENYDNLFDGDTSTKWCLNNTNPFVEFSTSELVYVTGYSFTTGDDTGTNSSRNPKTWKLYAKSSQSGAWEVIDSKSNDETLQAENEKEYQFALSKPTALRYQYFRLEFTHSGLMQLSEISVYGCNERSLCAHSKALTHHEGVPATCTTTGTREYWSCPDCDKMFSSATASAETMISDTTAPKLPHTVGADSKCSACGAPCISYLVPTYNTPGDASSGIASWTTAYVATSDVTTITSTSTTLPAGWYLVCNEVTITSRITCNGDVHLILAPDSKLNAKAGINVSGNANSLTIYGQPDGAGELIAMGGEYAAGIGGGDKGSGSDITINGGMVTATGGDYAAGIGGGNYGSGSNITINGGTVTATGGYCAAGIGGGRGGAGSDITINGGTVTATGGYAGAGIGGGLDGSGSDIKVSTNLVTWNRSNDDAVIANDGSDLASALSGVKVLWIGPSHTHNYINKVSEACMVTPATCTKLATYYRCCEICDKSEENQEHIFEGGKLKPHDFTNRVEDNDCVATGDCTTHATYYYCCAVCGFIENNAEHTFQGTTYTHTFVDGKCSKCQKTGVAYLVPTYKTARVKASGIASWTTAYVAEYTAITSESTTLSAGWYLVNSEVTINDRITCNGAVHLILATGSKLNAQAGIAVSGNDNSLTIYGQPDGAGELIATAKSSSSAAGIGGGSSDSGSNITINGGTVTATGDERAAGIGGGSSGSGSDITINGGTVTATGGVYAAGIGGGFFGPDSDIFINGGTVTATGGDMAAGIGCGYQGTGSTIFISTSCSVLAGTSTNMTVVTNDGSDLASKLNGKNVVRVKELSPGDLNADGNITISDLTLLVELLNAGGTITHPAADVDKDGSVDINDVNALRNKLLGK